MLLTYGAERLILALEAQKAHEIGIIYIVDSNALTSPIVGS